MKKVICFVLALVVLSSVASFSVTCSGAVIYVDDDATGNNDGSTWVDAFVYLQDALSVAQAADEIWVAEGVYKPDKGGGNVLGDREATFQLVNGVTLKGGYAGFSRPDPDTRDINLYETILSGDLNGDDGPQEWDNYGDNCCHVVTGSGTSSSAVLHGFTVTAGNANGRSGGGMFNDSGNPTLINCTFSDNSACGYGSEGGAGMYNYNSSPMLLNCIFSRNSAMDVYAFFGGGMYNNDNSNPILINCAFSENHGWLGGGIANLNSSPTVANCIFSGNYAVVVGGGIRNEGYYGGQSNAIVRNCIFKGNYANNHGAGIANANSNPVLTNCVFSGNYANNSGGAMSNYYSEPILINCILWGDIPDELRVYAGDMPLMAYSAVQGGWAGEGNIDADPLFVGIVGWEYPEPIWIDGRWVPQVPIPILDYHLTQDSPCIDAGDPDYSPEPGETDLDGNPRVTNGRIDMGAYEGGANNPPVADPGQDQNSPILFEAYLDGSSSYDPDEDYPLTYWWQILSKPQGSAAELANPDSVNPSFVPDLVGEYVIELVVTDSRGLESEPNYVVITAISIQQATDEKLVETIEQIGELDPNNLNNPNSANALINKIEAALAMLDEGLFQDALDKLRNDILKKTDGCANTGQPDKNDWILTCEDQEKVYPLVLRAIELLEKLQE